MRPLPNEEKLLALITLGDEKAFEKVFHHYRHKIYNYACHLLEDRDKADELVQEVFLKVWLLRDRIPTIAKFDAWLFIIARNRIFDMLKLLSRELSAREQMALAYGPEPETAENQLIIKENEELLRHALRQLSPRQQLIFDLSRHQGMKHEEIASRLHISRNTVKTHLVHAIKTLRNAINIFYSGILL